MTTPATAIIQTPGPGVHVRCGATQTAVPRTAEHVTTCGCHFLTHLSAFSNNLRTEHSEV